MLKHAINIERKNYVPQISFQSILNLIYLHIFVIYLPTPRETYLYATSIFSSISIWLVCKIGKRIQQDTL